MEAEQTRAGPERGLSGGDRPPGAPGRTAPHSDDAERALLGALLLDPEGIPDIAEIVRPRDFFSPRHRFVYESMLRLTERSVPADHVTLGQELEVDGKLERAGGLGYLIELGNSVTSAAHVLHHARIVSETSMLRQLIGEATEIIQEAYGTSPDGESVGKLLDTSEHRMFKISGERDSGGAEPLAKALEETFQRLDAASGREGLTGLTTGYYEIDEMLCGLNAGDLIILAARPSMGKTAFALNVALNTSFTQPAWLERMPRTLLYSLEMGRSQLASRLLCMRARIDAHKLRSGKIPPEDRQELSMAADELTRTGLFIDDTPGLTMMTLRSRARRLKAQGGLDLIVVDYLQLLTFPGHENRLQEISQISRSLKELARELKVPVLALAQLSRAVESRDPPRPQLSDLRESGSIEQDADVVLMLYRADRYHKYATDENRGVAEIICAKQRNGPTGDVKLQFFDSSMRFENRAPTEAEPMVY